MFYSSVSSRLACLSESEPATAITAKGTGDGEKRKSVEERKSLGKKKEVEETEWRVEKGEHGAKKPLISDVTESDN